MISVSFWRNRLGAKIVASMIAVSAIFSVGAAGIQLYLAYERDRARAYEELSLIDASFRDGLESALWKFSFDQVDALLDGIFAQHDIVYLELTAPTGRTWIRGEKAENDFEFREYQLSHRNDGVATLVGTLIAGLSLKSVRDRLWEQFWALVLSNFLKTFLASIAMIAIFDRLAARHLRAIAHQARAQWLETGDVVTIDRTQDYRTDELDDIVMSLNHARESVRASHKTLSAKLEELAIANKMLADANREQAEFTYAISHDLKSPTNTVRMLLAEFNEVLGDASNEDIDEILTDMDVTITRMSRLVDDVLAYARTVGEDIVVDVLDLNGEVQSIRGDLSADISAAGAELQVGALPKIIGNGMQIRLLLQNLISNALKFRDPAKPLSVSVEAVPVEDSDCIGIAVHDNGIGIEPEHHEKIFGLFKRLHTHSTYQGSGIGLAICQRIASNHGGRIEVSSQQGLGSTFTIVLPKERNGCKD